ncbi:nucleic acid/nucleotide deaminase domain-containing protein [Streptomyces megasporus]|uniref:nucleic acid/nucleotide deaminase domain-containing protein n=1 Tax=Streptomyces megasporus TaxID=44060 RepID=UPI003CCB9730
MSCWVCSASILIGRSDGNFHSERIIGHPLIHTGNESGLKEIFTEREPCQKNPRCNRWLDSRFPDTTVTHAADYRQDDPSTKNKEHKEYLKALKEAHGK